MSTCSAAAQRICSPRSAFFDSDPDDDHLDAIAQGRLSTIVSSIRHSPLWLVASSNRLSPWMRVQHRVARVAAAVRRRQEREQLPSQSPVSHEVADDRGEPLAYSSRCPTPRNPHPWPSRRPPVVSSLLLDSLRLVGELIDHQGHGGTDRRPEPHDGAAAGVARRRPHQLDPRTLSSGSGTPLRRRARSAPAPSPNRSPGIASAGTPVRRAASSSPGPNVSQPVPSWSGCVAAPACSWP